MDIIMKLSPSWTTCEQVITIWSLEIALWRFSTKIICHCFFLKINEHGMTVWLQLLILSEVFFLGRWRNRFLYMCFVMKIKARLATGNDEPVEVKTSFLYKILNILKLKFRFVRRFRSFPSGGGYKPKQL